MERKGVYAFLVRLFSSNFRDDRSVTAFLEGVLNLANWIVVIGAIRFAALKTHDNQLVILSVILAIIWTVYIVGNVTGMVANALAPASDRMSKSSLSNAAAIAGVFAGSAGALVYHWAFRIVDSISMATQ